ncbi:MAG: bifunctional riboflavin kinase/FAD synthetase [Candidatus Melainabacteria bacterium]|nr:bifunctional riboflavin kinase/FAD synthetase [Candidatus Melainabacteria bacterium]
MKIFTEIKPDLLNRSAVALGFFDGVHPGHCSVIKAAVSKAAELNITPALVTFRDHPRILTLGKSPQLLTVIEDRLQLFDELGVEATLVLTFSEELCRLGPAQYVQSVLVNCLHAVFVSIGYNHRFGRNREGDAALLSRLGQEFGFEVQVQVPVAIDGDEVSSSRVRQAVSSADMDLTCKLLGRPYSVTGVVMHGQARGRSIGFPTANLNISVLKLLPGRGVYAGICRLHDGRKLPAVINLGYRPTVTSDQELTAEVHILDFNQDLYGQILTLEFWRYLRAEAKFDNLDALKTQIELDCQAARGFFLHFPGCSAEQKLPV